jgi:uncharacterized protein YmfQ (DUF2313 family)
MAARFSQADYRQALTGLLPRGRAWAADPGTVRGQVLEALAGALYRLDAAAGFLLSDAFPSRTVSLLPEWEASLGLPDACQGETPSIPGRQNQVLARLGDSGGQSVDDLVTYADRLGFTITIEQFTPLRCGFGGCGDEILIEDAAHSFAVHAPETTVIYAECGISGCGDPFVVFGNTVLECEIEAIAPAHTIPVFQYDA